MKIHKIQRIASIVPFILLVIATCLLCIGFSACYNQDNQNAANGLDWIKEESYFLDYTIDGTIVEFRYLFTFENTTHRDMIISFPQVKFSRKELKGWLEYKDSYIGISEDGSTDNYIPAGKKVSIVLSFKGNYLGGDVNTRLSIPTSIIFGQKLVPKTD